MKTRLRDGHACGDGLARPREPLVHRVRKRLTGQVPASTCRIDPRRVSDVTLRRGPDPVPVGGFEFPLAETRQTDRGCLGKDRICLGIANCGHGLASPRPTVRAAEGRGSDLECVR